MWLWPRLSSFWRNLFRKERVERELSEEVAAYLELLIEAKLDQGIEPAEARRQALIEIGGIEQVKESVREVRMGHYLETLLQDTRYALRRLRNSPAFAATVVLTLALGIGATTSIFTLAHAVLMKSLAVANPDELYRLGKEGYCCYWGGYTQEKEFSIFSYDLYKYFRDNTQGFAELAAFQAGASLFGVRRSGSSEAAQSLCWLRSGCME